MNKPESVFEINEDCKNSILSYLEGQQVDINSFITSLITKCRSQEADIENFKADAIDIFALCDAIGNGVYIVDKSSVIISSNEYYDRLTGLWKNEYLNKPVRYVLDRFFYNSRAVATEALRTGKKATGIGRSKRTDKDFLVTAIPYWIHQALSVRLSQFCVILQSLSVYRPS